MTVMSQNVEELLKRLETNSKSELNLVRALAAAIMEVDDQTLREMRAISMHHELRRETILGELQLFAARMCQLPVRASSPIRAALDQSATHTHNGEISSLAPDDTEGRFNGADWRKAAQNIQDELDEAFGASPPRH